MRVSELYDNWAGQDCYIVGTGPSLNVFPLELLREKNCILLNDAQKHLPGLGPIAFANNRDCLDGCQLPYQIVKGRLKFAKNFEQTDNHVPWDHPRYHVFSYREPPWDALSHNDEASIFAEPDFYWAPKKGSVSAFAVQFALLAGFRTIYLVGCDCNAIGGAEYVAGKFGATMRRKYAAYQYGLLRLHREAIRRGVSMVSVQPFFGLGWHEHQYQEMQADGRLSQLHASRGIRTHEPDG